MNYTYPVQSVSSIHGRRMLVVVDLGFGLPKQQEFLLAGVTDSDESTIKDIADNEVRFSERVFLRSFKRADNSYYADITYFAHGVWYNLSKETLRGREEVV